MAETCGKCGNTKKVQKNCPGNCHGTGQVRGANNVFSKCGKCKGVGVINSKCSKC